MISQNPVNHACTARPPRVQMLLLSPAPSAWKGRDFVQEPFLPELLSWGGPVWPGLGGGGGRSRGLCQGIQVRSSLHKRLASISVLTSPGEASTQRQGCVLPDSLPRAPCERPGSDPRPRESTWRHNQPMSVAFGVQLGLPRQNLPLLSLGHDSGVCHAWGQGQERGVCWGAATLLASRRRCSRDPVSRSRVCWRASVGPETDRWTAVRTVRDQHGHPGRDGTCGLLPAQGRSPVSSQNQPWPLSR